MAARIALFFTLMIIGTSTFAQIEHHVKWSYASKMISKTEAVVYIKADIDKGWHIYAVEKGGPAKSAINFIPSKSFTISGNLVEPKPAIKYEKVFHSNIGTLEGTVLFQQKVKFKHSSAAFVTGKVEFTACNNIKCLPPEEVAFTIPLSK